MAEIAAPTDPRSPLLVAADADRLVAWDLTFPGGDGETITAYQTMPIAFIDDLPR